MELHFAVDETSSSVSTVDSAGGADIYHVKWIGWGPSSVPSGSGPTASASTGGSQQPRIGIVTQVWSLSVFKVSYQVFTKT